MFKIGSCDSDINVPVYKYEKSMFGLIILGIFDIDPTNSIITYLRNMVIINIEYMWFCMFHMNWFMIDEMLVALLSK